MPLIITGIGLGTWLTLMGSTARLASAFDLDGDNRPSIERTNSTQTLADRPSGASVGSARRKGNSGWTEYGSHQTCSQNYHRYEYRYTYAAGAKTREDNGNFRINFYNATQYNDDIFLFNNVTGTFSNSSVTNIVGDTTYATNSTNANRWNGNGLIIKSNTSESDIINKNIKSGGSSALNNGVAFTTVSNSLNKYYYTRSVQYQQRYQQSHWGCKSWWFFGHQCEHNKWTTETLTNTSAYENYDRDIQFKNVDLTATQSGNIFKPDINEGMKITNAPNNVSKASTSYLGTFEFALNSTDYNQSTRMLKHFIDISIKGGSHTPGGSSTVAPINTISANTHRVRAGTSGSSTSRLDLMRYSDIHGKSGSYSSSNVDSDQRGTQTSTKWQDDFSSKSTAYSTNNTRFGVFAHGGDPNAFTTLNVFLAVEPLNNLTVTTATPKERIDGVTQTTHVGNNLNQSSVTTGTISLNTMARQTGFLKEPTLTAQNRNGWTFTGWDLDWGTEIDRSNRIYRINRTSGTNYSLRQLDGSELYSKVASAISYRDLVGGTNTTAGTATLTITETWVRNTVTIDSTSTEPTAGIHQESRVYCTAENCAGARGRCTGPASGNNVHTNRTVFNGTGVNINTSALKTYKLGETLIFPENGWSMQGHEFAGFTIGQMMSPAGTWISSNAVFQQRTLTGRSAVTESTTTGDRSGGSIWTSGTTITVGGTNFPEGLRGRSFNTSGTPVANPTTSSFDADQGVDSANNVRTVTIWYRPEWKRKDYTIDYRNHTGAQLTAATASHWDKTQISATGVSSYLFSPVATTGALPWPAHRLGMTFLGWDVVTSASDDALAPTGIKGIRSGPTMSLPANSRPHSDPLNAAGTSAQTTFVLKAAWKRNEIRIDNLLQSSNTDGNNHGGHVCSPFNVLQGPVTTYPDGVPTTTPQHGGCTCSGKTSVTRYAQGDGWETDPLFNKDNDFIFKQSDIMHRWYSIGYKIGDNQGLFRIGNNEGGADFWTTWNRPVTSATFPNIMINQTITGTGESTAGARSLIVVPRVVDLTPLWQRKTYDIEYIDWNSTTNSTSSVGMLGGGVYGHVADNWNHGAKRTIDDVPYSYTFGAGTGGRMPWPTHRSGYTFLGWDVVKWNAPESRWVTADVLAAGSGGVKIWEPIRSRIVAGYIFDTAVTPWNDDTSGENNAKFQLKAVWEQNKIQINSILATDKGVINNAGRNIEGFSNAGIVNCDAETTETTCTTENNITTHRCTANSNVGYSSIRTPIARTKQDPRVNKTIQLVACTTAGCDHTVSNNTVSGVCVHGTDCNHFATCVHNIEVSTPYNVTVTDNIWTFGQTIAFNDVINRYSSRGWTPTQFTLTNGRQHSYKTGEKVPAVVNNVNTQIDEVITPGLGANQWTYGASRVVNATNFPMLDEDRGVDVNGKMHIMDMELTLNWTQKIYALEYDYNIGGTRNGKAAAGSIRDDGQDRPTSYAFCDHRGGTEATGGNCTANAGECTTATNANRTVPRPTIPGYTFKGWVTDSYFDTDLVRLQVRGWPSAAQNPTWTLNNLNITGQSSYYNTFSRRARPANDDVESSEIGASKNRLVLVAIWQANVVNIKYQGENTSPNTNTPELTFDGDGTSAISGGNTLHFNNTKNVVNHRAGHTLVGWKVDISIGDQNFNQSKPNKEINSVADGGAYWYYYVYDKTDNFTRLFGAGVAGTTDLHGDKTSIPAWTLEDLTKTDEFPRGAVMYDGRTLVNVWLSAIWSPNRLEVTFNEGNGLNNIRKKPNPYPSGVGQFNQYDAATEISGGNLLIGNGDTLRYPLVKKWTDSSTPEQIAPKPGEDNLTNKTTAVYLNPVMNVLEHGGTNNTNIVTTAVLDQFTAIGNARLADRLIVNRRQDSLPKPTRTDIPAFEFWRDGYKHVGWRFTGTYYVTDPETGITGPVSYDKITYDIPVQQGTKDNKHISSVYDNYINHLLGWNVMDANNGNVKLTAIPVWEVREYSLDFKYDPTVDNKEVGKNCTCVNTDCTGGIHKYQGNKYNNSASAIVARVHQLASNGTFQMETVSKQHFEYDNAGDLYLREPFKRGHNFVGWTTPHMNASMPSKPVVYTNEAFTRIAKYNQGNQVIAGSSSIYHSLESNYKTLAWNNTPVKVHQEPCNNVEGALDCNCPYDPEFKTVSMLVPVGGMANLREYLRWCALNDEEPFLRAIFEPQVYSVTYNYITSEAVQGAPITNNMAAPHTLYYLNIAGPQGTWTSAAAPTKAHVATCARAAYIDTWGIEPTNPTLHCNKDCEYDKDYVYRYSYRYAKNTFTSPLTNYPTIHTFGVDTNLRKPHGGMTNEFNQGSYCPACANNDEKTHGTAGCTNDPNAGLVYVYSFRSWFSNENTYVGGQWMPQFSTPPENREYSATGSALPNQDFWVNYNGHVNVERIGGFVQYSSKGDTDRDIPNDNNEKQFKRLFLGGQEYNDNIDLYAHFSAGFAINYDLTVNRGQNPGQFDPRTDGVGYTMAGNQAVVNGHPSEYNLAGGQPPVLNMIGGGEANMAINGIWIDPVSDIGIGFNPDGTTYYTSHQEGVTTLAYRFAGFSVRYYTPDRTMIGLPQLITPSQMREVPTITPDSQQRPNPGPVDLVAQWTAVGFNVSFNVDGNVQRNYGSNHTPPLQIRFGTLFSQLENIVAMSSAQQMTTMNLTRPAKFGNASADYFDGTAIPYFGSGANSVGGRNYGRGATVANGGDRDIWVFDGWYTALNNGGTKVGPGTAITGNVTYFAGWRVNTEPLEDALTRIGNSTYLLEVGQAYKNASNWLSAYKKIPQGPNLLQRNEMLQHLDNLRKGLPAGADITKEGMDVPGVNFTTLKILEQVLDDYNAYNTKNSAFIRTMGGQGWSIIYNNFANPHLGNAITKVKAALNPNNNYDALQVLEVEMEVIEYFKSANLYDNNLKGVAGIRRLQAAPEIIHDFRRRLNIIIDEYGTTENPINNTARTSRAIPMRNALNNGTTIIFHNTTGLFAEESPSRRTSLPILFEDIRTLETELKNRLAGGIAPLNPTGHKDAGFPVSRPAGLDAVEEFRWTKMFLVEEHHSNAPAWVMSDINDALKYNARANVTRADLFDFEKGLGDVVAMIPGNPQTLATLKTHTLAESGTWLERLKTALSIVKQYPVTIADPVFFDWNDAISVAEAWVTTASANLAGHTNAQARDKLREIYRMADLLTPSRLVNVTGIPTSDFSREGIVEDVTSSAIDDLTYILDILYEEYNNTEIAKLQNPLRDSFRLAMLNARNAVEKHPNPVLTEGGANTHINSIITFIRDANVLNPSENPTYCFIPTDENGWPLSRVPYDDVLAILLKTLPLLEELLSLPSPTPISDNVRSSLNTLLNRGRIAATSPTSRKAIITAQEEIDNYLASINITRNEDGTFDLGDEFEKALEGQRAEARAKLRDYIGILNEYIVYDSHLSPNEKKTLQEALVPARVVLAENSPAPLMLKTVDGLHALAVAFVGIANDAPVPNPYGGAQEQEKMIKSLMLKIDEFVRDGGLDKIETDEILLVLELVHLDAASLLFLMDNFDTTATAYQIWSAKYALQEFFTNFDIDLPDDGIIGGKKTGNDMNIGLIGGIIGAVLGVLLLILILKKMTSKKKKRGGVAPKTDTPTPPPAPEPAPIAPAPQPAFTMPVFTSAPPAQTQPAQPTAPKPMFFTSRPPQQTPPQS